MERLSGADGRYAALSHMMFLHYSKCDLICVFLMIFFKDLLIGHMQKFENSDQYEETKDLQFGELDSFFLGGACTFVGTN